MENRDKSFIILGGIGISIIFALLFIPSFAYDNTYFVSNITANMTTFGTLNNLTDVVIVNVDTGDILTYNGTFWVNAGNSTVIALDDLTDVIIVSPVANQFLFYNGTDWINGAITKTQLPSSIAYEDEDNFFTEANYFEDSNLKVYDSDKSHVYSIRTDNLGANKNLYIPVYSATDDTIAVWGFPNVFSELQTLQDSMTLTDTDSDTRILMDIPLNRDGRIDYVYNGAQQYALWYDRITDQFNLSGVDFTSGQKLLVVDSDGNVVAKGDVIVNPTERVYLDGGSDTFLRETIANKIDAVVGGATQLGIDADTIYANGNDVDSVNYILFVDDKGIKTASGDIMITFDDTTNQMDATFRDIIDVRELKFDSASNGEDKMFLSSSAFAGESVIGAIGSDAGRYVLAFYTRDNGNNNVKRFEILQGAGQGSAGITMYEPIDLSSGRIEFPAVQTSSTGVNTLDDYEEGSWTPTGNNIVYATAEGNYIKIGKMVMANFRIVFPATADVNSAQIRSLPFTVENLADDWQGGYITYTDNGGSVTLLANRNSNNVSFYSLNGNAITNLTLSGDEFRGVIMYSASQ